jgi:hypothetical protein
MIGIGHQPAGITLAGLGHPEELNPLPIPQSGAPYISLSGNYVIDDLSGDVGRDRSARHRVLLAMRTIQMSAAADSKFGFKRPAKITERFESEFSSAVNSALKPCTSDGSVRLDDVTFEQNQGGIVHVTIHFTDMLTQAKDSVTV